MRKFFVKPHSNSNDRIKKFMETEQKNRKKRWDILKSSRVIRLSRNFRTNFLRIAFRSSRLQMFFRIGVLKNFSNIHRKAQVLQFHFNKNASLKGLHYITPTLVTSEPLWSLKQIFVINIYLHRRETKTC